MESINFSTNFPTNQMYNKGKEEEMKVNVNLMIQLLSGKKAVIFCRVSSIGQTGQFAISFEVQEEKGYICSRLFNLKVMGVMKVVESAYDGKSCTLKSLIRKNRGGNIIIYNVSRFCRNVAHGISLLEYALKNNTRLIFVEEGFIWDHQHQNFRRQILRKLEEAQQESINIGNRVRAALQKKKQNGYFTGGTPKYGYSVVEAGAGKKAVEEEYEQSVIEFIEKCKTVGTTVRSLNTHMSYISPDFDVPIELFADGVPVGSIRAPMSNPDIAELLNAYGVTKRGSRWNASKVSSITRRNHQEAMDSVVSEFEQIGFR